MQKMYFFYFKLRWGLQFESEHFYQIVKKKAGQKTGQCHERAGACKGQDN